MSAALKTPLARAALDWIQDNTGQITDISDRLWMYCEPPMLEYRSSAWLVAQLRDAGFEVEECAGGLPTAFVATYGRGAPVLGTLVEYETVEDASQMPVPTPHPVGPGLGGCYDMHHGLAAGGLGAALAVSQAMRKLNISGTLKVFGTPAEKTAMGKNVMARAGLFDGLDACVSWHPSNETSADRFISQQIRCNNQTSHTFHGVSAYNATPWGARNAQHAAALMDIAVQYIKDAIVPVSSLPTISSIVDDAGPTRAVSSIPDYARVIYVSRALTRRDNLKIQERLFECAEAAAKAIGVSVKNEVITGTWESLPNLTLARLAHANIEVIGPPAFSETDIRYGQLVQENLKLPPSSTPFGRMDAQAPGVRPARNVMATTDTTVFCHKCPYVMVTTNYLGEWGLPNWATASYGLTHIAHAALLTGARIVAATLADLFCMPEVLLEARKEFLAQRGDLEWSNPLPAGAQPAIPPPLPDEHYRTVIESFRRGPKWEGWEPELSQRMERIAASIAAELGETKRHA